MSWEVRLLGVELASMARADEVDGVCDGSWPVETLSQSVSNRGPWCCMVTMRPRVYVLEELPAFFNGDTPLKNPFWTTSVQLFVVAIDNVGLGPSSDTASLTSVF